MKSKILCIIPARKGSKRLKQKNIKKIFGKPIIEYTIDAAIKSKLFSEIVVSSDIDQLERITKKKSISFENRKKKLAGENKGVVDVCLDLLKKNKYKTYDILCVLYATAALRTSKDIIFTYKKMKKNKNFSMAITPMGFNPYQSIQKNYKNYKLCFPNFVDKRIKADFFIDNGSTYFAKVKSFKKEKSFYGKKIGFYEMPADKSIDINTQEDFNKVKQIFKSKYKKILSLRKIRKL